MSELTQEQKNKLMVCAKAFFDDEYGHKDYPFNDVSEQYDEFVEMLGNGEMSWSFLDAVYKANK